MRVSGGGGAVVMAPLSSDSAGRRKEGAVPRRRLPFVDTLRKFVEAAGIRRQPPPLRRAPHDAAAPAPYTGDMVLPGASNPLSANPGCSGTKQAGVSDTIIWSRKSSL